MRTEETVTSPNYELLVTGAATFGLAFLPSVAVAVESSRVADSNLYVPVLGPWLDLLSRSSCPIGINCAADTGARVALVLDGVLQTAGALQIVGALAIPHRKIILHTGTQTAGFDVTPARMGRDGYGMMAVGKF